MKKTGKADSDPINPSEARLPKAPLQRIPAQPSLFSPWEEFEYVKGIVTRERADGSVARPYSIVAKIQSEIDKSGLDREGMTGDAYDRIVLSVINDRKNLAIPFKDADDIDSEDLLELFRLYLVVAPSRSITQKEMVRSGDFAGTWSTTETPAPLTEHAFCSFAGISMRRFQNWAQKDDPRGRVAEYIQQFVRGHMIERGLIGSYNARLTQLVAGLSEKTETVTHSEHRVVNINIDGDRLDLRKRKRVAEDASYEEVGGED